MHLLGNRLRQIREEKGLPLRKIAAFLDIDTSILSKIERSERPINLEILKKLSTYYKIDYADLKTEFHAEQIAKIIYNEKTVSKIFVAAEAKVKYFKSIKNGKID